MKNLHIQEVSLARNAKCGWTGIYYGVGLFTFHCKCNQTGMNVKSQSESVSLFVRPQALTNKGTITFVLINIICDTPLELFLSLFAVLLQSQNVDGK